MPLSIINTDIPPLKTTDTVQRGIDWMDEFKVYHLPLVNEQGKFLGNVSETDLIDSNNASALISELAIASDLTSFKTDQHFLDVIRIFSQSNLSVIPIVDGEEQYKGCVSYISLFKGLMEISFFKDYGGIISLQMNQHKYSMTQIANIIESDGAQILGSYIIADDNSSQMEVTIKVNKYDLGAIIQTFERYGYSISATFDNKQYEENMKNRFGEFMNYLNL